MQKYQGLPTMRNQNLQRYKLPGDLFVHESVRGPRRLLFFPSVLKCTAGAWLLSCAMEWPIQTTLTPSPAFLPGVDNSCLLICQKRDFETQGLIAYDRSGRAKDSKGSDLKSGDTCGTCSKWLSSSKIY